MDILIFFAFIIILLLIYSVTESLHFKVTEYSVAKQNLPEQFDGKSILLLSDLHCTSYGRNNIRLIQKIKALQPDIIIIAGDLINGKKLSEFDYALNFLNELAKLEIPIYYTYGNHEVKLTKLIGEQAYNDYTEAVKDKCILVNNRALLLGEENSSSHIKLYGLNLEFYYYAKKRNYTNILHITECMKNEKSENFSILIAHDPYYIKQYLVMEPDIIMSGHLHGGIIRLPFIGGIISPRYEIFPKPDKGLYQYGKTTLILSGGLGWHGIPFRFLNLPEIVRITLNKEDTK